MPACPSTYPLGYIPTYTPTRIHVQRQMHERANACVCVGRQPCMRTQHCITVHSVACAFVFKLPGVAFLLVFFAFCIAWRLFLCFCVALSLRLYLYLGLCDVS